MDFKVGAVYKLPNGRELIAQENGRDKIVLHNGNSAGEYRYELNENQRLLLDGRLTAWGAEDLVETGRTEASEQTWSTQAALEPKFYR